MDGKLYIDTSPLFGLRSAASMMQRTSEGVAYIVGKDGLAIFPYIDDLWGC